MHIIWLGKMLVFCLNVTNYVIYMFHSNIHHIREIKWVALLTSSKQSFWFAPQCICSRSSVLPGSTQAHLLSGKLLGSLRPVTHLTLCLQIHIQTHAQALDLIGQELETRTWPLQLGPEHVHLALDCLITWQSHRLENNFTLNTWAAVRLLPAGYHQCSRCALLSRAERERRAAWPQGNVGSSPQRPTDELRHNQRHNYVIRHLHDCGIYDRVYDVHVTESLKYCYFSNVYTIL